MKASTKTYLIVGAVGVVAFLLYQARQTLARTLTTTLNPASDQNLAYRGVNGAGAALTGDESFSLGSYIYDLFNPEAAAYDPNAGTFRPQITPETYNPYAPGGYRPEYVTRGDPNGIGGSLFSDTLRNIGGLIGTGAFPTTTDSRSEYVTRNSPSDVGYVPIFRTNPSI